MILWIQFDGESNLSRISGASQGHQADNAASNGGTGSFSGPTHTASCPFGSSLPNASATFSKRDAGGMRAPRNAACYYQDPIPASY
jgi:hypothetical protein